MGGDLSIGPIQVGIGQSRNLDGVVRPSGGGAGNAGLIDAVRTDLAGQRALSDVAKRTADPELVKEMGKRFEKLVEGNSKLSNRKMTSKKGQYSSVDQFAESLLNDWSESRDSRGEYSSFFLAMEESET